MCSVLPERVVSLIFSAQIALGYLPEIINSSGSFVKNALMKSGQIVKKLDRGNYQINITPYPVAFFHTEHHDFLIHATDWNRLDISSAETGKLVTARSTPAYSGGGKRPAHSITGVSVMQNPPAQPAVFTNECHMFNIPYFLSVGNIGYILLPRRNFSVPAASKFRSRRRWVWPR